MAAPTLKTEGHEWNHLAKQYTYRINGVAVRPIAVILQRANELLPFREATAILDNGCGPGPIMTKIIEEHGHEIPADATLTAVDLSQGMVDVVRAQQKSHAGDACWDRLHTSVLDATNLSDIPDNSISHITAGWVYFLTGDPLKCLTESYRVLRKGGVLALSSWQANAWMSIMLEATKVRPETESLFPDIPEAWKTVDGISGELQKAGFEDIGGEEVPVAMAIDSREGTVDFFTNNMPHVKRAMQDFSDAEKIQARQFMMEEMDRLCPSVPGTLSGVSVVAWARK